MSPTENLYQSISCHSCCRHIQLAQVHYLNRVDRTRSDIRTSITLSVSGMNPKNLPVAAYFPFLFLFLPKISLTDLDRTPNYLFRVSTPSSATSFYFRFTGCGGRWRSFAFQPLSPLVSWRAFCLPVGTIFALQSCDVVFYIPGLGARLKGRYHLIRNPKLKLA